MTFRNYELTPIPGCGRLILAIWALSSRTDIKTEGGRHNGSCGMTIVRARALGYWVIVGDTGWTYRVVLYWEDYVVSMVGWCGVEECYPKTTHP